MSTSQQRPRRSTRNVGMGYDEEDALPQESHAKRSRTENGVVSNHEQVNGRSTAAAKKAKPVYDEEDDGFTFTRKSKRKAAPVAHGEPAVFENETNVRRKRKKSEAAEEAPIEKKKKRYEPADEAPVERRKKKSFPEPAKSEGETIEQPRRRSKRVSGESQTDEGRKSKSEATNGHAEEGEEESESMQLVGGVSKHDSQLGEGTKIALPFADTPIIRRNKELRKGGGSSNRRSSLGNRGRRASSLMDSGTSNAVPHKEVEVSEFYKHIAPDIPEPRRMKQLLTWCGTRALGEKPVYSSKDVGARQAARVIQEELLKDFSNRSEMSDWFNREETAPTAVVKKPNPRNIANAAKIQELEEQLKRLQEERAAWEALSTSASALPPLPPPISTIPTPSEIDASLLDPEQAAFLNTLLTQRDIASSTQNRIQSITSQLEFQVDQFADGVHKLDQYRVTADRIADQILAQCADSLAKREEDGKESAGTAELPVQEVLRSLSRMER
ncbi:MAG: hypothetical protein M1827_004427 [Pycnora praestabilis]|nr:MAG: hypothetical protein M1827_004427 [Pycnora praestabilis]